MFGVRSLLWCGELCTGSSSFADSCSSELLTIRLSSILSTIVFDWLLITEVWTLSMLSPLTREWSDNCSMSLRFSFNLDFSAFFPDLVGLLDFLEDCSADSSSSILDKGLCVSASSGIAISSVKSNQDVMISAFEKLFNDVLVCVVPPCFCHQKTKPGRYTKVIFKFTNDLVRVANWIAAKCVFLNSRMRDLIKLPKTCLN